MTKNELLAAAMELECLIYKAKTLAENIADEAPALNKFEIGNCDEVSSLLSQALDCCEHMIGNVERSLDENCEKI